ncbi:MAG: aspartate aminotransferase family protein [Candidatus Ranarchaeia archaeon]
MAEEIDWSQAPKIVSKDRPKSKAIAEQNLKYVSLLQTGISTLTDIVVDRARGAVLKDVDGNLYIDFTSAITTNNIGYADPDYVKAIQDQVARFQHMYEFPTEARGAAAQKLIELAEAIDPKGQAKYKVIFSNSGAESIEIGLRLAELVTGKNEVLHAYHSYHGKTRGTIGYSSISKGLRKGLKHLTGRLGFMYPYCAECLLDLEPGSCGFKCLDSIDWALTEISNDNCGVLIMESINGNGCIVPPPGYYQALKEKIDDLGLLFFADEVQSGCGRTGKMFAIEHWPGVVPDIITTGKGLAAGLPAGSTIFTPEIEKALLDQGRKGQFTLTFAACATVMAGAAVALSKYQQGDIIRNAARQGEYLDKRLAEFADTYPGLIWRYHGKGLLWGLGFKNPDTGKPDVKVCLAIINEAFKNGMLIWNTGRRGNFVKICPPLVITREELDKGLEILDNAIRTVQSNKLWQSEDLSKGRR